MEAIVGQRASFVGFVLGDDTALKEEEYLNGDV